MQTQRSINLDRGWRFGTGSFNPMLDIVAQHFHAGDAPRIVDLPHDYMIESDVSADAPAGAASGFYTAGPAYYTRLVDIPAAWAGQEVFLQLDGAMMNATVEVNGSRAALQHNGYIPFAVRLTPYLTFGEENRITVNLNPSMQPNSRWYTGAGLFRSVRLVHCPKLHLAADGLFAWTRSLDWQDGAASLAHLQAEVDVCNETGEPRVAEVEVWLTPEAGGEAVARCAQVLQVNPGETAVAHLRFVLEKPALWQAGSPNLYRLHARVTEQGVFTTHLCPAEAPMTDEDSVLFGVRTVQVDPVHGLRINGRTTKLKGGCLHHDNGVAGAVSLYDLEVRKLQALQAIGFNAVRTAHNPPSAAFIEACDRLGLYVLDEAFDAWGMGKQPGDYNQFFDTDWQRDLAAFVRRDRAHPSVILWSTGNEIVERGGLGGGYPLAARLAEAVHALDPSRPVTNAICSYWNGTDDATAREIATKILASGGGVLQNIQGDSAGDTDWERRSEAFTNGLDVVGYNYMEDKYEQDHALYPQRVILGTENYAREIGVHWPLVEKLPYVLGDFTWTACDYIGEAGLGKGMMLAPDDPQLPAMQMGAIQQSGYPWRLADDADLDLTGHRLPQGDYRSIVWGSEATALFSYDPADFGKVEVLSRWGFPGVQRCWTWPGAEGKPARVVVFSRAQEVVLLQNGAETARAQAGAATLPDLPLSFVFEVPYTPGKLEAVSYQDGREISRDALETTGAPAALRLTAEGALRADGHSVACVWAEVVDAAGRVVPNAAPALTAGLSGAGTLAGFGSANPITTDNYAAGRCQAYRGRALAVVRGGYETGSATLTVTAEGLPTASLTLAVAPAGGAV